MEQDQGATLYVSTNGNDTWSGKLAEAKGDGSDGPFATLQKARDAVRALKEAEGGLASPVKVVIRGGTYFLAKTLMLTDKDSGSREYPLTWCAYQGETPVISGGQAANHWKPYKGAIQQAEWPPAQVKQSLIRQLFFRGQRQRRSRWPKYDPENPIRGGWAFPEGPVEEYPMRAFHFKADAFPRKWTNPQEGEVKIYAGFGWVADLIPIRSIDYDERIVWLAHNTFEADFPPWFIQYNLNENSRYVVENLLEELSEPGEWCCDTSEGKLYFWPPEEEINDGDVIMPVLDCLIDMRDTQWINILGLTFTHTTTGDETHRNREDGLGAMFPQQGLKYCGEALHMRGTSYCTIQDCRFDQVGGNAIYMERNNLRNTIQHNEIGYAGANAIVLVGDRAFHPLFNEVVDNHIHHAGRILNYVAGVFLGNSDGNLIAHNHIHDMPHHAINLGSNGMGRNYVEYNEIRRVCLEIADTGAINSWMDVPGMWIDAYAERSGHIIRYNLIVDVPGCLVENGKLINDKTTRGIYLDDCTSNCYVYGNVIIRAGMGFMIHAGKHNVIENNIVIDCRMGLHGDDWPPVRPGNAHIMGMFRGNHFTHNIVYSTLAEAYPCFFYAWNDLTLERCDQNLYFLTEQAEYKVPKYSRSGQNSMTYEEWQQAGYDLHSVIADPCLINQEDKDIRLGPDSPAFQLGFQAIDLSEVGTRDKS